MCGQIITFTVFNLLFNSIASVDFSGCPKSCDGQKKPSESELVKCPLTSDVLARQSYQVSCNSDGNWTKNPTTLDTSSCPSLSCDNAKRPNTTEIVACPDPFQNEIKSKETYQVTCSGQTWIRTLIGKDDSSCSKSCSGAMPENFIEKLSCQSPYQFELLAEQKYIT